MDDEDGRSINTYTHKHAPLFALLARAPARPHLLEVGLFFLELLAHARVLGGLGLKGRGGGGVRG
jgi:hypothetical protein